MYFNPTSILTCHNTLLLLLFAFRFTHLPYPVFLIFSYNSVFKLEKYPFRLSPSVSLLATNSLCFCLFENVFLLPSFLMNIFVTIEFLVGSYVLSEL